MVMMLVGGVVLLFDGILVLANIITYLLIREHKQSTALPRHPHYLLIASLIFASLSKMNLAVSGLCHARSSIHIH